jgi:SAM-dependent methyltransferase
MTNLSEERATSYGEDQALSLLDRLGVFLNDKSARREVHFGAVVADIGSGFNARLAVSVSGIASRVIAVDISLREDLGVGNVECLEGRIPEVLRNIPSDSIDICYCVNVLEHLSDPELALTEIRRISRPKSVVFLNVPSWRGKRFLEYAAFRRGWAPATEMNDHKCYFDPKDLWPLLVRAGFKPQEIDCKRVKLGLNTRAIIRRSD